MNVKKLERRYCCTVKKEMELTSFLRRIFRKDHQDTHLKNGGPDGI